MGDDMRTESLRPDVKILLVGVALLLDPVVTPLEALLAPHVEALLSDGSAPQRDPADVEAAVLEELPVRREPVRHDGNWRIAHLVKQRLRGREKAEVGIEVGQGGDRGVTFEDESRQY